MAKVRILFFVVMVLVVGALGYFASLYARGYRLDTKTLQFSPNGLLVINSDPKGAQIYINGALKTATDATINLAPGSYDIQVKKDGFITWQKNMNVEKEIVTQADVFLFPSAGTLSPITFSGAVNPIASSDYSKIAYIDKDGLWITETFNLPIGFNREPRQITDGDLTGATIQFSPDGRQILLTLKTGSFVLDTGTFTPQAQRVNTAATLDKTLADWQTKKQQVLTAQLGKLPPELQDILTRKASDIVFSPDENKVLYTASDSASIPNDLIKQLPGSSTQRQERDIRPNYKYVYDIKEDRNFKVADPNQPIYWFSTSAHLIIPEQDKIAIEDYDGTNQEAVYTGSYIPPYAYPFSNTSRLIVLTNLGASGPTSNLYSLSLR